MKYWIIIERGRRNCSAYCPDVPGCAGVGRTVEATIEDMRKALAFHFEGMEAGGESIPVPGPNARAEAAAHLSGPDLLASVDVNVKTLASA
jgi:predicted RNase H-like HicB family nuclease